jgi:phosphoribosylanthranilate isomerase
MSDSPLIQVAGVIDQREAEMLLEAGVDWLGFPLRLTVNQEDLSEEAAGAIIRHLPSTAAGVLITYADSAAELEEMCETLGTSYIQLHGEISLPELQKLRLLHPKWFLIKSLIVNQDNLEQLSEQVRCLAPYVDAFITDTFDPETGACGATGICHDWSISRELVRLSPKPVIIAGGLNADNVKAAVLQTAPAGVDVHTGVEQADGRKDPELVRRFVREARAGFAELLNSARGH